MGINCGGTLFSIASLQDKLIRGPLLVSWKLGVSFGYRLPIPVFSSDCCLWRLVPLGFLLTVLPWTFSSLSSLPSSCCQLDYTQNQPPACCLPEQALCTCYPFFLLSPGSPVTIQIEACCSKQYLCKSIFFWVFVHMYQFKDPLVVLWRHLNNFVNIWA